MANVKTLSAALKLIDTKKESLKKAFEDLQRLSSSLSSFTLTWPDLDSHFSSLQSSLERDLNLLRSQPPKPQSPPPSSSPVEVPPPAAVRARPELRTLCEAMNGLGLRRYIVERSKDRSAIRDELPDALRCAPDAPAMVLDAMKWFYKPNSRGDRDKALCSVRSGCLILLDELMEVKPEIKPEVRERAMKLAAEWKGKASLDGENTMDALGFLHLVACYGLVDGFDIEEIVDFAVMAATARHRQAIKLCRVLGLGDRISDVIQKLISKGKRLPAVKVILEFGLAGKFPPVPLLKDYVKESKKFAQEVRSNQKSTLQELNEAKMKEVSALQQVIKCIEDHKLESEYRQENLVRRLAKLKKETASKRRPRPLTARVAMTQPYSKTQEHSGIKRPRTIASANPAAIPKNVAGPSTVVHPLQEHPALYLSSPAEPYGLVVPTPASDPYGPSHAGPAYGSTHAIHTRGPTSVAGPTHAVPAYAHTPATGTTHAVPTYGPNPATVLTHTAPAYDSTPGVHPYGSAPSEIPYQTSYAGLYGSAETPVEFGLQQPQYHPSYYQQ